MLTRIALVSRPDRDLEWIRSEFRNPVRFTYREFLSMQEVLHGLIDFPMDLMLLRLPQFREAHLPMLHRLRGKFQKVSVIVMAGEAEPRARAMLTGLERLSFLADPEERRDLSAMIERWQRGQPVGLRQHARIKREGEVILTDRLGKPYRARFLDFAQMGARVVVESLRSFDHREALKVDYASTQGDPGRRQVLEARVVWSKDSAGFVDSLRGVRSRTLGLRFVAQY